MSQIVILNAHQPYPFSTGQLNAELVTRATQQLQEKGHQVKTFATASGWDIAEQLAVHQWADIIIVQSPVNWMGMPWSFKKYMDEVYTAGMDGSLCEGDGRTTEKPTENYGTGGALADKRYMLSLTFNAPERAFNDQQEFLFQGKSVDDLMFPMHMNFRFFGMTPIETFACYDVMKNPSIENDFVRFQQHINNHF